MGTCRTTQRGLEKPSPFPSFRQKLELSHWRSMAWKPPQNTSKNQA